MSTFQPGPPEQQQKVSPDSIFYKFSPEEARVIKECNQESFFQRSLPLSLIFGGGTYMGVNAGYIKKSVKWGPWPKIIVGGLLGYIIGKYSYQTVCAEKLMQIPDSEIGRVLRERRGKLKGSLYEGNAMSPSITSGSSGNDIPSFSTDYKSDLDIDMHKPMDTLDTDYRPDYDGFSANKANEIPFPSFNTPTSYDELRARNRQDFERTLSNKPIYRTPPPPNSQPVWDNQPYPTPDQTRYPQPKESRNQYGDVYN